MLKARRSEAWGDCVRARGLETYASTFRVAGSTLCDLQLGVGGRPFFGESE